MTAQSQSLTQGCHLDRVQLALYRLKQYAFFFADMAFQQSAQCGQPFLELRRGVLFKIEHQRPHLVVLVPERSDQLRAVGEALGGQREEGHLFGFKMWLQRVSKERNDPVDLFAAPGWPVRSRSPRAADDKPLGHDEGVVMVVRQWDQARVSLHNATIQYVARPRRTLRPKNRKGDL